MPYRKNTKRNARKGGRKFKDTERAPAGRRPAAPVRRVDLEAGVPVRDPRVVRNVVLATLAARDLALHIKGYINLDPELLRDAIHSFNAELREVVDFIDGCDVAAGGDPQAYCPIRAQGG